MRVKKTHAYIGGGLLAVLILAFLGNRLWNTVVMPSISSSTGSLLLTTGIALIGGLVTFFTPCGLAILPAFLSYNFAAIGGTDEKNITPYLGKLGVFAALGMMTFFIILGGAFAAVGSAVNQVIVPLQYLIAALLVVFGYMLYKNKTFASQIFEDLRKSVHEKAAQKKGYKAYYIFGFAYGLDAIGCLFPLVFAVMLLPLLSGNFVTSLSSFIAYSVGIAIMLTIFAYGVARQKKKIIDMTDHAATIRKVTAVGLMLGGTILLAYYKFFGMVIG